ncbi:MAG TPA: hypothetical protein VFE46_19040 [Pirellulales bacterium]|jgi:hypothetical protein|nr:hypothetical protein [Pirellulales bacterium]
MGNFVIPAELAAQLAGLPHPVNLCDASGKKLGYFVPAIESSDYEIVGPDLSPEEYRKIEQSSEWHTTAEVLRHLESLQ